MLQDNLQAIAEKKMLLAVPGNPDPRAWAETNKREIEALVAAEGALLVRGLEIVDEKEFGEMLTILYGEDLAEYTYRSTPRTQVVRNVYTATEYHPSEVIPQHNENAYADSWPLRIGFLCQVVAEKMGNTPISDSRTAYQQIPREIREEFEEKKVMYVRNYSNIDLPWSEVFQTTEKKEVEKFCTDHDIRYEWTEMGLRTRQVNPAVISHPLTGDRLWFNQAHLFHFTSLNKELQEGLIMLLGEENLPRNAYFGDGTSIDEEVLAVVREVYQRTKFSFQWRKHDLLLLDNMLFTHGREPFEGSRKVLVGMGREYSPAR